MLRSLVAVLAGLVVTLALVMITTTLTATALGIPADGRPTPPHVVFGLLGAAIAGLGGGLTAMRFAPHRPHGHVVALAGALLLLSLPTVLAAPSLGQPEWYTPVLSLLGPLSVLTGGFLGARWRRHSTGGSL